MINATRATNEQAMLFQEKHKNQHMTDRTLVLALFQIYRLHVFFVLSINISMNLYRSTMINKEITTRYKETDMTLTKEGWQI